MGKSGAIVIVEVVEGRVFCSGRTEREKKCVLVEIYGRQAKDEDMGLQTLQVSTFVFIGYVSLCGLAKFYRSLRHPV